MEKTIKNSWKVELEKKLKALELEQNEENPHAEQEVENSGYNDTLHIPYIEGFAGKLATDLRVVIVGVTFQKRRTIKNSVCKLKPLKHPD